MAIALRAEERTVGTQGQLNKLRQQGVIPGVVYGKQLETPRPIKVDEKELLSLLRSHPHALLEIEVPGVGKQPVMLTEVQRDPLTRSVVHIDLHQINMNETVKTPVRIEVVGEAQGAREGGILQLMIHELEIQCLPNEIPEAIEIDVTELQMGDNLLVSDLLLPKGVTTRIDAEQVVVTVLVPQKDLTEEEAEDAAVESVEADQRAKEANMDAVHTE
ncbi:50S ribosomal protein L25 [Paenibacillus oenotherae]|uniref:Large ribosomal subunit protein bL25 n=1 Tax=Paenibacillus oenotherae TaxID=1435645 RepID=A0ABS7DBS3_9BACL|nr:50S ribosomal protein L25 [Paenibacillus oenotherae]MBW7477389.1 50S ribosomal protein L25 [Paenibacillus oenotherae]